MRDDSLRLSLEGAGPLLQRDYWAVIDGCRLSPEQVIDWISRRFAEFSPPDRAIFTGRESGAPLRLGDRIEVRIRFAGRFRVEVIHQDALSFTLGTVRGHPEAGRITFGAYRNRRADVIFHIRSRARSSARFFRAGFLAVGDPMQLHTWTDFVETVARSAGKGVIGRVHAETSRIHAEPDEDEHGPTYLARAA